MSTYSDAWHNTPPAVRDFYRNFSFRYCRQARRITISDPFENEDYFWTFGWLFLSFPGYAIACHNWTEQLWAEGSFNPAVVLMRAHEGWSDPSPGPPYSAHGAFSFGDQWIDIPEHAINYPREKRKVTKSYWTGKPVKRRNL